MRRKIDLVDHQEVRSRNAGSTLPWNLVARGHIDDVDREIDQLGTERCAEVVAAAFDNHEIEVWKLAIESVDCREIHRSVFPDCSMWASARFDANNAILGQGLGAQEKLRVFLRVNVVGHHGDLEAVTHPLAQSLYQARLAGPNGSSDT